ncbi:MAG: hypothetical protein IPP35_03025 [Elusimicrobia bacterium]|nr:hypothetical protein [Elusimicrobiota bacterium]
MDISDKLKAKTSAELQFELFFSSVVHHFPIQFEIWDIKTTNSNLDPYTPPMFTGPPDFQFQPFNSQVPRLALTTMIYASQTSWHPEPPTLSYLQDALSVAHSAVGNGTADGIVTFFLDKSTPPTPEYLVVKDLFSQWNTLTPPRELIASGGQEALALSWFPPATGQYADLKYVVDIFDRD